MVPVPAVSDIMIDIAGIEMLERLSGATGLPQGVVSTVAVSASFAYKQRISSSGETLRWLFQSRAARLPRYLPWLEHYPQSH